MKKGVFAVIFVLLALGFMYAPVEKVSSVAQGFCYQGESSNLVSVSDLPKEVSTRLNYGGLLTDWKVRVESLGVVLLMKNINSQGIYQQEISGLKHPNSTDKCEFWTFSFQRNSGALNYNLPLDREETDAEGRKTCYYKLTNQAVSEIVSLGGGAVSQSNICPELVNGRTQTEGSECAATAACTVNIKAGEKETFALGVEKDYCGKEFVYEVGNGNSILGSDMDAKAKEFVADCQNGKGSEAAQDKGLMTTPVFDGGGSGTGTPPAGGGQQQNTGASCGCNDVNQNQPIQDPCAKTSVLGKLGGKADPQCEKLPDYCKSTGNNPPGIIFCKECLEFKNRYGWDKTNNNEQDCSASDSNGKDCKYYTPGGLYPDKPFDSGNWVYGICKNGVCGHDVSALKPGQYCSCECYFDSDPPEYYDEQRVAVKRNVGLNEYCQYSDTDCIGLMCKKEKGEAGTASLCIKKEGPISKLNGNICQDPDKTRGALCNSKSGSFAGMDPKVAATNCEAQGKLFYVETFITAGLSLDNKCNCVTKPKQCK